ncbi:hypothetical protein [Neoroseomonas rubea]|uniref:hypothetical protein n=1 Tax=Neoroseomonas rubea TaxID=2748666 RepID=UPI0018DF4B4A|nr:hypothetical protein [Roseomonas rubea]
MTRTERDKLKADAIRYCADAAEAAGGMDFPRTAVIERLMARGAGRTFAYKVVGEIVDGGEVDAELDRRRAEMGALAAGVSGDAEAIDLAPVARHPAPTGTGVAARIGAGVSVASRLEGVIGDIERVRAVAFFDDGRIKNSRMVLKAAEEMRRSLETVVKLQQAMNDIAGLERFHTAIIDVIRAESPELAHRVLRRLDDLATRWGG